MSRDFTLIFYSVPEDFDDVEQPNAFGVSKAADAVTLRDIKTAFPLEGTYHFRFKYVHNKIPVWMDLNNEDAHVPLFLGKVIAKVTRISWESSSQARPEKPQPTQTKVQQPQLPVTQSQPAKQDFDIFDSREERPPQVGTDFDLLFSR